MDIYDIAIIGGGPAGMMAAIRAGELKRKVLLIERNSSLGKKILLTGKGRCNITNAASIDTFIDKFGGSGEFFRTAFQRFFNKDLMAFFASRGLELKCERQGRVFPATDKAESVLDILKKSLLRNKVEIRYNMRLSDIFITGSTLKMDFETDETLYTKRIVLATGGASYKATGSSGDGFRIAEKLGHTIVPLKPGLVPLKTKEQWVKTLKGMTLMNVRLVFLHDNKKLATDIGELIFTHFGISGPLVLDVSGRIISILERHKSVRVLIDLKCGLDEERLDERLRREFREGRNAHISNVMKNLLPRRLAPVILRLAGVDAGRQVNQITQTERRAIVKLLKGFPLTVVGALPLEEAMVTSGGVSTHEINPRTMESKIVSGLYFAGEIIEGSAPSGGYSLQQAFSTGYLAGESAAQ